MCGILLCMRQDMTIITDCHLNIQTVTIQSEKIDGDHPVVLSLCGVVLAAFHSAPVTLEAGGKPSTRLPLGRLVEHNQHPSDAVTNQKLRTTHNIAEQTPL